MKATRLAAPLLQDFVYLAQNMRPDEKQQFLALTGLDTFNADTAARALAAIDGPSWVLVDRDGYPFLAGGFEPLRPGVFECWLVGTLDGWATHACAITRVCRLLTADLFAQGAHRIQTVALASRTQAHTWYERCAGLTREGVLRGHFADGQDGVLFARTAP
jgi:hypothetical protein